MKATLFLFFVLLGTHAHAQTAPTTLGATMKAMAMDLRQITNQAANPAQNASSAALADQLVDLTVLAESFVPDSISSLAPADQAASQAEYVSMLEATAQLERQLSQAFKAGDNAGATAILKQINDAKMQGHGKFNPN